METQLSDIATLNDAYRTANPGRFMLSSGVMAQTDAAAVIAGVRSYRLFTEDNDPCGEHDFGRFELGGETIFWKIDYYDQQLKYWCDPLDPQCCRVLTVMLAEEY